MMKLDFHSSSEGGPRGSSRFLAAVAAVSIAALGASAPGCQGIAEPVDELAVGSDRYAEGGQCPEWQCGTNHEIVSDTNVGELNLDGEEGNGGFQYVSFIPPLSIPLALSLDVVDGQFVATDTSDNEYSGAALEGGLIVLLRLSDVSLHVIKIAKFDYVDSWTDPVHSVPSYRLESATYSVLGGPGTFGETCGIGSWTPLLSLAYSNSYAVLVEDERYDPATKTITETGSAADRWFNIACNGSALAKMKLLGYDPVYGDTSTTFASTTSERQATLKMITADYCGTGRAFTVEGQPLIAENADGTALLASSGATIDTSEAIWDETGALCLDIARRAAAESGIEDEIADECEAAEHDLPDCDDFLPDWESAGLWRSWNPE